MTNGSYRSIRAYTNHLLQRMYNPMCGLIQKIGFILRATAEPRLHVAGVDLCGVHVLQGCNKPALGGYHIGGSGVFAEESIIKCLSESVERYSQLMPIGSDYKTQFSSYADMKKMGMKILDEEYLNLFSAEQLNRQNFPFQSFDTNKPLLWLKMQSILHSRDSLYVPLQLLQVGYQVQKTKGEPWLNAAVTTGTAVHTSKLAAVKNALLELIQVDTAMGHWYTQTNAYNIILDDRTKPLERLILKYVESSNNNPVFYWLINPNLEGFVIACMFKKNITPYYVIGLGADTDLLQAMYKAFLEAAGVLQLAKLVILNQQYGEQGNLPAVDNIFDLDNNVALYARRDYANRIRENFLQAPTIVASKLPTSMDEGKAKQVDRLISGFKKNKYDLYQLDLSTIETCQLGLYISRLWSPQLLSLTLPSAVPRCHPRFIDYGQVSHEDPHPYP